jgi:hypothetical protein
MIPDLESRYEVVESTSSRLVFRQQYSTSDKQRQVFRRSVVIPIIIVLGIFLVVNLTMNVTVGGNNSSEYPFDFFPAFLMGFVIIMVAILRSRRFGFTWLITTTLDKDRGTIELEGLRVSRSGEVMASRLNKFKQYPLTSTEMFSIEPVIVNGISRTTELYGLRLSCKGWLPVFVFQSTNREIVADLKRLVEGFLKGAGAPSTVSRGGMELDDVDLQDLGKLEEAPSTVSRGGMELDRPGTETGTLFRREHVPRGVAISCPFCGSPIEPNGSFCPRCGAKLN